jgi:ABC-2 type transport system ATP-binding protein
MAMIEVWTDRVRTAGELVRGVPGVSSVSVYGDRLHIGLAHKEAAVSVLEMLQRECIAVQDHREILPSLEDVFIAMVEERT